MSEGEAFNVSGVSGEEGFSGLRAGDTRQDPANLRHTSSAAEREIRPLCDPPPEFDLP